MLLYMLKISIYRSNWLNHPVFHPMGLPVTTPISVVIAFRNEEENLPRLLNSLEEQDYPTGLWEVILVDDHSSDGSVKIVTDFVILHPGFRYLKNEPGEEGKKPALLKGIRQAMHSLIITTDADCTMGKAWLSTIGAVYKEQAPALVIGLVDIEGGRGFFNRFQEVEFLSLIASGAAAAAGGRPIYCNAANLAFKKELILSYPDPMNWAVPSGDDTLFMHRIKRNPKNQILLLKSGNAIVKTLGARNGREFMNQRGRWASKSRYYTDRDAIYAAVLVFTVSLIIILSVFMAISGIYPALFPVIIAGKSVTDYFFLKGFFRFYKKKLPVLQFLLFETIYPVYILIAAFTGLFNRYSWKERTYFKITGND